MKKAKELRINKERILEAIKALPGLVVNKIEITYDGSGDSGCIDGVRLLNGDVELQLPDGVDPEVKLYTFHSSWVEGEGFVPRAREKKLPLKEAIEQFAYDWIALDHSGWENNEGAYGTVTIDVELKKATHEHNMRIESVETYNYEV